MSKATSAFTLTLSVDDLASKDRQSFVVCISPDVPFGLT